MRQSHTCLKKEPRQDAGFFFSASRSQAGNVLFYVFLAVGLMAALTYAFVKDSRENYASQSAVRIAEELFVQVNTIRSAVQQCAMEFPEGGAGVTGGGRSYADLNGDSVIDNTDNPNLPYPLSPSSALLTNALAGCTSTGSAPGCIAATGDGNNYARNLTCVGAPLAEVNIFQGNSTQGRFLPPPPPEFSEWSYLNDANGVYVQITANPDAAAVNALNRLKTKFNDCQATFDYNGCGARCLTVWILRASC